MRYTCIWQTQKSYLLKNWRRKSAVRFSDFASEILEDSRKIKKSFYLWYPTIFNCLQSCLLDPVKSRDLDKPELFALSMYPGKYGNTLFCLFSNCFAKLQKLDGVGPVDTDME